MTRFATICWNEEYNNQSDNNNYAAPDLAPLDVTKHNHDASGAPTYPTYRDRCPVGCDDLTPVRMADTNVQYVGKYRLVTRRLVPDGPSQFRHPSPPPAEPTLDVERLAYGLRRHAGKHARDLFHHLCGSDCAEEIAAYAADNRRGTISEHKEGK